MQTTKKLLKVYWQQDEMGKFQTNSGGRSESLLTPSFSVIVTVPAKHKKKSVQFRWVGMFFSDKP